MNKIFFFYLVIRSFITYALWAVIIVIFTLFCTPFVLLPASIRYENRLYFFFTTICNRLLLLVAGVRLHVIGAHHLPAYPENPSIIVMNHSSALDICLAEICVGTYPHMWMSKIAYGRIPFFSILLKRMNVMVKRESLHHSVHALAQMASLLKDRASHGLIFPEGKRYCDGKIHTFFSGFAVLAHRLNRPVIPFYFHGLHKIFPSKSWILNPHATKITVIIGQQIKMIEDESVNDFSKRVQKRFIEYFQSMYELTR